MIVGRAISGIVSSFVKCSVIYLIYLFRLWLPCFYYIIGTFTKQGTECFKFFKNFKVLCLFTGKWAKSLEEYIEEYIAFLQGI